MGRYIKPSIIFLLLLCIAVACDGTSGNNTTTRTIGPEGGTIRSADGKLTLVIPAGALTEDTEITVRRLNPDEISEEFADTEIDCAYELTPEGLEFNIPIRVSVNLDDAPVQEDGTLLTALAFLVSQSDDGIEILTNTEMEIDGIGNTTTVSADLTHFSNVARIPIQGLETSTNLPVEAFVNESFMGTVEISATESILAISFPPRVFPIINNTGATFSIASLFSPQSIPSNGGTSIATINGQCNFEKIDGDYTFVVELDSANIVLALIEVPFDFVIDLYKIVYEKKLSCIELVFLPPPPPQPTEPPPPLPEIDIDEILAQYELNCQSKQDTFQIFIGNFGGSPFSFPIIIDLNNENRGLLDARGLLTTDIIITTPDDLFTLEGQLTDLENGTFGAEAEGSGFLGDMNPAAADIIVKAEGWIFDLDEEGNVILREGDLRFNFPELPLDNQSSVAECTGIKAVE